MTTNAGTVSIAINADDKSQQGFNSATQNIKNFADQIKSMEAKIKPVQDLLKNGIVGATAITGLGTMIVNSNILNGALQVLKGGFSQLNSEVAAINDNIDKSNTLLGGLADNIQKNSKQIVSLIANISNITVGIITLVQTVNSLWEGWTANNVRLTGVRIAMLRMECLSYQGLANAVKQETLVQLQRQLLLKSELPQLLLENTLNATSTKVIDANTSAITRNSIAMRLHSAGVATCTAAQTVFTTVCSATTAAINWLTTAIIANPIIIGAAAVAAGIYFAVKALSKWYYGVKDNTEANKKYIESMEKMAESAKKFGESQNKFMDADRARLERLKQLSEKQNKSKQEIKEAQDIVRSLSLMYHDLGLSVNATTGEISGFNEKTKEIAKSQMAQRRVGILKQELDALRKASAADGATDEQRQSNEERIRQINTEIRYYEEGGLEDVTGKSEADIIQMRIDAEKKAIEEQTEAEKKKVEEQKKLNKEKEEREKEINDIIVAGREFEANLEKEINKNNQNALQNELDALNEQIDSRRQIIQLAIAEGKATAETYEQLTRLDELQNQRVEQIKQKYQKQTQDYQKNMQQKIKNASDRSDDNAIKEEIKNNPFSALKTIEKELNNANNDVKQAEKKWKNYYNTAKKDGILDEKEQEKLKRLENEYDKAQKKQDRYKGYSKDVEERIQADMQDFLKNQKQQTISEPVAALQQGTTDALKQAMENQARVRGEKSPEAVELNKIRKALEKKYADNEKQQKEQNENLKKLVNNVKGVG